MRPKIVVMCGTVAAVAAAILSQFGAASSPAGAGAKVNLVGRWTAPYQFPTGTDQLVTTTETLVIQRQDGQFLWGHDDSTQNGQAIQIPVRGSLEANDRDFTLAEKNGFFRGTVRSTRGCRSASPAPMTSSRHSRRSYSAPRSARQPAGLPCGARYELGVFGA